MKKLILLSAAVLAFAGAQAQKTVTWGVKAGMNVSNVAEAYKGEIPQGMSESDFTTGYESRIGYQFGVTADVRLSDRFYLQPELLFTNLGAKHSERENGYSFKETVSLNYLQLPIQASLRFALSDKVQWHLNAGPYLGLGLGGKIKYEETYQGETETYQIKAFGMTPEDAGNEDDARGGLRRFNMGLTFGTGFSFGHVYVGVNYDLGLTNMLHKDMIAADGDMEDCAYRSRNLAVSVGFRF